MKLSKNAFWYPLHPLTLLNRHSAWLLLAVLVLLMVALVFLFRLALPAGTDPYSECRYLEHLSLSGQYQQHKDGSLICQSRALYMGSRNQHTLYFRATGQKGQVDEMRLSLRLGEGEQRMALGRLLRFGNSLVLPVLGHTMPAEVGQYLKNGHVGHWDFNQASLYIERHRFPAAGRPDIFFEDVSLVLRKNRLH